MKSVFRNLIITSCLLVATVFAISCSNGFSGGNGSNPNQIVTQYECKTFYTQEDAINNFGKVSKIYSNPSASSRFYTGQKIRNFYGMKNNIVFEANLVEYDSLDPKVTKYVENIDNQNALMHQNYGEVEYISGKTYVELASYKDLDNDKICYFEVRIFDGDFWNTRNDDGWYAKSVTFSPDFKIDVDRQVNIETGEKSYYKYPYAEYYNNSPYQFDESKYEIKEVSLNDEKLNTLGTVSKVYKQVLKENETSDFDYINEYLSSDENLIFDSYMVEFNSLASLFKKYSDAFHDSTCYLINYDAVDEKADKIYVEYIVYTGENTKVPQFYELRIKDSDNKIKNISLKAEQFDYLLNAINTNMSYEEFSDFQTSATNAMKTLGNFVEYYDRTDGLSGCDNDNTYRTSRLFEYSSLSTKALNKYDELVKKDKETGSWSCMWFTYNQTYKNEHRYIELVCDINRETNKIEYYEFRFKEPTGYNAHSCYLTKEQFDAFIAQ